MTKTYKIKNLDCANCASKIERSIGKLKGVNAVTVNFMTQKISLDAQDDLLAGIEQEMAKIADKIEPGTEIIVK